MELVSPLSASKRRVSCTMGTPAASESTWRRYSASMARVTETKELRFFISVRVPRGSPGLCMDRFTSQRIWPRSMAASLAPTYSAIARSFCSSATACAAVRMSGSVTISISGTPQRLKSTSVPLPSTCTSLPASSSMCMRFKRMRRLSPSTTMST